MRPRLTQSRPFAFTLLELLILIAIMCILAALLLPARSGPGPVRRGLCISNQRQVVIGLIIFSSDHRDVFPASVSTTNGGAMEQMASGEVVPCYAAITNVVLNPNTLLCPNDKFRFPAPHGQPITRTNVSYFISLDASPTNSPTYTILTGDRHLSVNTKPIGPGLFSLSPNQTVEWTSELHSANKKPTGGAFSFADGHAEWVSPKSLSQVIVRQNMPTNRLAVP